MEMTQEQTILQSNIRKFVAKEVEPLAARIDQQNYFPQELMPKIADLGLFGIMIPEVLGGFGFDTRSLVITLEEVARSSASLALVLATHNAQVAAAIMAGANDEVKKKWLPELSAGTLIGGACAQDYVSVRADGGVLKGTERIVLNGMRADLLFFKALDGDGVIYRVIRAPRDTLKLEPREDLMGMRGAGIGSVVFDGAALAKTEALAASDAMLSVDDVFHLGLAAIAVGISQSALEAATKYAKERKQFGQAIGSYDMVQEMLAEMATRTHGARLMLYDAADRCDAGKPFGKESAMTKAYAAQSASSVTRLGVQVHGGYGYIKDYAIERMYRDAKVTEVIGGTTETLRLNLARSIL